MIHEGVAEVTRGKVTDRFARECARELKEEGVLKGEIRGVKKEGYVGLEFSKSIPEEMHQRLRNIWSTHDPD